MPRDDASNTEYRKDNAWVDSALIVCTVRRDTKEEADVALFITAPMPNARIRAIESDLTTYITVEILDRKRPM